MMKVASVKKVRVKKEKAETKEAPVVKVILPPKNEKERKLRLLKALTVNFYQIQENRIACFQRSDRFKAALADEDKPVVEVIEDSFESIEKEIEKKIKKLVCEFDIYNAFLKDVRGIGPTMAAILISEFDIQDAPAPAGYGLDHQGAYEKDGVVMRMRTISQWWRYAGLDCIEIDQEDGTKKTIGARRVAGQKIKYNPWLRSKLLGVLGDLFIKLRSPYRKFYDGNKAWRIENKWGESDLHRHRDSIRHMIKCFLMDFFYAWRKLENLPSRAPYAIDKLGKNYSDIWHLESHPCINKEDPETQETGEKNVG